MLERTLRATAATAIALALPALAQANDIVIAARPVPILDTEQYCLLQAASTQGRYDRKQCGEDEARSASIVGRQWAFMPDEVQVNCTSIARRERGSYFVLEACMRHYGRAFWRNVADEAWAADRYKQVTKAFRR